MRVLLISHTCQSRTEGQPKAEILARMPDIELQVLVPDRWKHYGTWRAADVPSGSPIFRVGKVAWPWMGPAQFYLHYYPGLRQLLTEFRPDVIDLWEEPWGLVSAQTCRLRNKLLPGTRIVSETEQNLNRRLPPPFERFRSYTLKQADFLVGRSREAVAVAKAKGYAGPAATVPNAVDTQLFRPMDRQECRQRLGWPSDRFIVGYIGRLVERKGISDLIEAMKHAGEGMLATFIGDGPMDERIEAARREEGLADRLLHVPGKPLAELPTVMNALDVMVLPSWTVPTWKEQFGRVIIESHACGVPVIGTDSGAIPEVIEEGGVVYREREVKGLVDAILRLKREPGLRQAMGAAGLRQVAEKYTWERVAERMAEIYRHCVRRGRSG